MAHRRLEECAIALTFFTLTATAGLAQGDPKGGEPGSGADQPVADQIQSLRDAARDRTFGHDAAAVGVLADLEAKAGSLDETERRDALQAIRGLFWAPRRDAEHPELYEAALHALGTFGGADASRILLQLEDSGVFHDDAWLPVEEQLIENVGRTKDERHIDRLLKLAGEDPRDALKAAAATALRNFAAADPATRAKIVEGLLSIYRGVETRADASRDPDDADAVAAQHTLDAIADPFDATLAALTGKSFHGASDWAEWWQGDKIDRFLHAVHDRKFARDKEAIRILDELTPKYAELSKRNQRDLLKALDSVFVKPLRDPAHAAMYEATLHALGTIGGPHASRILVKVYDSEIFESDEWMSVEELLLENIGRTKDPRQVDFLLDRATRDPHDAVKRAAGKALRYFEDADLKTRQDTFKDLLTNYATVESHSKASLDPGDSDVATAKRTLAAIADSWNLTLSKLSGQEFRTAARWLEWWNKAKYDRKMWR